MSLESKGFIVEMFVYLFIASIALWFLFYRFDSNALRAVAVLPILILFYVALIPMTRKIMRLVNRTVKEVQIEPGKVVMRTFDFRTTFGWFHAPSQELVGPFQCKKMNNYYPRTGIISEPIWKIVHQGNEYLLPATYFSPELTEYLGQKD